MNDRAWRILRKLRRMPRGDLGTRVHRDNNKYNRNRVRKEVGEAIRENETEEIKETRYNCPNGYEAYPRTVTTNTRRQGACGGSLKNPDDCDRCRFYAFNQR